MIYSNGEVIGVLRYVTSTRLVNRQIVLVCLVCCFVLTVVLAVVLLSSGYCIRSILNPVAEITEKAQRIASGSYGRPDSDALQGRDRRSGGHHQRNVHENRPERKNAGGVRLPVVS